MKRIAVIAVLGLSATAATAQNSHQVRGYFRSDGTYVAPHVQTNPDNNPYNNWSSRPNINPYTGQQGTVDPYRAQPQTRSTMPTQPNVSRIWGN